MSLLAITAAQRSLKAAEIAREHGIPSSYLNNVLFELRRLGLVTSRKGSNGGYQLARPAEEINLLSLHRGLAGGSGADTPAVPSAPLAWLQQLEQRWLSELEAINLSDIQAALGDAVTGAPSLTELKASAAGLEAG